MLNEEHDDSMQVNDISIYYVVLCLYCVLVVVMSCVILGMNSTCTTHVNEPLTVTFICCVATSDNSCVQSYIMCTPLITTIIM